MTQDNLIKSGTGMSYTSNLTVLSNQLKFSSTTRLYILETGQSYGSMNDYKTTNLSVDPRYHNDQK